jgi:hypothetical protein
MSRVNLLKYPAAICVCALLVIAPIEAGATTSPSPSLDTVLIKPPAADFSELTSSPLNGSFTAHDFAALNANSSAAAETEATLKKDGFVEGYGKTWAQISSGHGLIEAVMAFAGGQGARNALTGLEQGDKADSSYKHANTISGITPYYGAHFVDSSSNVVEDFFAFVKGNDVFAVLFVSDKDDVADLAASQTRAQYDSAPQSTIPTAQWPENATSTTSFPAGAVGLAVGFVVVVFGLVAFLVLRRRSAPIAAAYAVAPTSSLQMSPDGNYWWDGESWRDAALQAPADAQRSSDGSLWWDGRTWRSVPQPPATDQPT